MLLLLTACASPLIGETLSDDGTWRLVVAETTYDQGAADVRVHAERTSDGAPDEGLRVYARPGMDDMDHARAVVDFADLGAGDYAAQVTFDMSGLWVLTGYVDDDAAIEGFTFVVEVAP